MASGPVVLLKEVKTFSRLLINYSTQSHSKKMLSDVSTPIHAYLSCAGLLNALKICSGANKKVCPQLAGPMNIILSF